jgi:ribonucleoside-diphosphate reductase alpha chain
LKVLKRTGKLVELNLSKINLQAERVCKGLEDVSVSELALDAQIQFFEGISTREIDEALILSARSKIEKEPNYSYVAARLLLSTIYKDIFKVSYTEKNFDKLYKKSFIENVKMGVNIAIYDNVLAEYDLEFYSSKLKIENDLKFDYFGAKLLEDRYLLRNRDGEILETPQMFWMRVALGLGIGQENQEEFVLNLYEKLSNFEYCPSTPTLFNSGTIHSQLSSCYGGVVEDSLGGIFGSISSCAQLSKWSGGLGMSLTPLRARNSKIQGTGGVSSGILGWVKCFNAMISCVDQGGGKRTGSLALYLEPWHLDFEAFLDLRRNVGDDRFRAHDTHFAAWICDEFMSRVKNDADWYLVDPKEFPELYSTYGKVFSRNYNDIISKIEAGLVKNFKQLKAKDLWKKILSSLFETGYPWITFKDAANLRYTDKNSGIINSTNLCTEIFLHSKESTYDEDIKVTAGEYFVCSLGSVNLNEHILDDSVDWEKLKKSVIIGIKAINATVDLNYYPIKETENFNRKYRPLALGVFGWHDLFQALNIAYDSPQALELSSKIQEFVHYWSIFTSVSLTVDEGGAYEAFGSSEWAKGTFQHDYFSIPNLTLDWEYLKDYVKKFGMRNSCVNAIAPNASIANVVGASNSIDPYSSVLYVFSGLTGKNTIINKRFVKKMKILGLWDSNMLRKIKLSNGILTNIEGISDEIKEVFKDAWSIPTKTLIDHASARQMFIDQGQSFNVYCSTTSLKELSDIYMYAWEKGLKSTYYLRNKEQTSTEKVSLKESQEVCSIENKEDCLSCQ